MTTSTFDKVPFRTQVARFVSIAFHPFVLLTLAVIYAASPTLAAGQMKTVIGTLALSLLAIGVYVLVQVKRGVISNIDVSKREQRPQFYLVAIVSSAQATSPSS